jgi:hypothetical protein
MKIQWGRILYEFKLREFEIVRRKYINKILRVPGYRSRSPGLDSRHYQTFWEVMGLERGPLSLLRIIEELFERKVAVPVWKTEINGRGDSLRWLRDALYPLKLALTSPTSCGRSIGIVYWQTKAPESVKVWHLCANIEIIRTPLQKKFCKNQVCVSKLVSNYARSWGMQQATVGPCTCIRP